MKDSSDMTTKNGISGPVDRLFEELFEDAIRQNEIRPAMYLNWQNQKSVAREIARDGQLYALSRQIKEDGLILRIVTKVQIKDTQSLLLKSIEFGQVRKVSLNHCAVVDASRNAMLAEDDYKKINPYGLPAGVTEARLVTMTLHRILPDTVVSGIEGNKVGNLAELPERFAEISEMTIVHVSQIVKGLIVCCLV